MPHVHDVPRRYATHLVGVALDRAGVSRCPRSCRTWHLARAVPSDRAAYLGGTSYVHATPARYYDITRRTSQVRRMIESYSQSIEQEHDPSSIEKVLGGQTFDPPITRHETAYSATFVSDRPCFG